MEKIPRLTPEQRDNLVAYLDNELDDQAAQEIEQVLSKSEVARHEVDMLSRTWDALGTLPRARASGAFTQNTMSLIQVPRIPKPELAEQAWYRATRRGAALAGWLTGVALSAYFGFMLTNRWIPTQADLLLDELPIIEQFDQYTEVGRIEFLRELKNHGTFNVQPETSN